MMVLREAIRQGASTGIAAVDAADELPEFLQPDCPALIWRRNPSPCFQKWVDAFEPELIIISAGFDAHRVDPLAELNWETDDFVWLTRQISTLADKHCDGRIVSTLEGGYDLNALAESTAAHVNILMEASA